jgi:excisionase family DNA binding protein
MTGTTATQHALLTTGEVAARFNTSRRTVRRYVERGLLPAIRLRGGLRFDPREVEAFLAARRTGQRGDGE